MNRRLAALATLAAIVAPARADAAGQSVSARVDRTRVAPGEIVRYSIVVAADHELNVGSSAPGNLDGFELLGKMSLPTNSFLNMNGVVKTLSSFTTTYTLRAKKPGSYTLGPGRFVVNGKQVSTPAVKVEVAIGAKPPSSNPFRDPFFDMIEEDEPPPPPPKPSAPSDPLARVDEPEDRAFFTRVVPDRKQAIVGEQVTLKLFVYARDPPKVFVKRPPVLPDFRHVPLGGVDKMWQQITIGDELWVYGALEAFAAFPLRAGKLSIGPSIVETVRELAFGKGEQRDVESKPTEIEVIEPPLEGRPPGYVLGDVVADLALTADVAPRTVTDGHALLTLRMKGAGRLDPLRPHLPTPKDVTWTTTADEVQTRIDALTVVGDRKLQFDARFDRAGEIELGEAVMHVWDPKRASYVSVRAPLGKVVVNKPAESLAASGAPALATLPPPRGSIGASGTGGSIAEHAWTWLAVAGAPLLVALARASSGALRRRREREAEREADPAELARRALREAAGGDRIGASTRALDRAIEAATGVRPRGLTRAQLESALAATSLDGALAGELVRAFDDLESARFAGGTPPALETVEKLVERVLAGSKP